MAGLVVRAYLIATTVVVSRDSITFITYAKGLRTDPVGEMRQQAQHPLYPATILAVHALVGRYLAPEPVHSWPLAGQMASLAGGLLAIGACYALGKAMWNRRVGLIVAFFAAMLPDLCQLSADALSDALHLGLYLWGLVAVIRAQQTNRMSSVCAVGVLAALGFLTRPEGGTILAVGLAVVVASRSWKGLSWRRRAVAAGVMLLCFAVVAGPYMLTVGRLVRKKSLLDLFGLRDLAGVVADGDTLGTVARVRCSAHGATQTEPSDAGRRSAGPSVEPCRTMALASTVLPTTVLLLYQWVRACRVVYLLLAIPCLRLRSVTRPNGLMPVFLAAAMHTVLLHALHLSFGYLGRRHVLVLAALTLPFAAATFGWLVDQASGWLASKHRVSGRLVRAVLHLLGGATVVGPTLPWMVRPIGGGSAHLVAAGRWLHEHSRPGEMVLTYDSRIAYYAERPMQTWPDTSTTDDLTRQITDLKAVYFVMEKPRDVGQERRRRFYEEFGASPLRARLTLIYEQAHLAPPSPDKVLIFRIAQPASAVSPLSRPDSR